MTLFSVNFYSQTRNLPNKAIEYIFGEDDWIRLFDGTLYLVASERTADILAESLRKVIPDGDSILVLPVGNSDLVGFMPKQTWDWLRKYVPNLEVTDPANSKITKRHQTDPA